MVRLVHVCAMDLLYPNPCTKQRFLLLPPGNATPGSTVTGERLCGTMRWLKHVPCRADALPDIHGLIQTDDGAPVMFCVSGAVLAQNGKLIQHASFEADDARYHWLASADCFLESMLAEDGAVLRAQVYARVSDGC